MADETVINGEFSDDPTVEVTGNEASAKFSRLSQKISDLELKKGEIIRENKEYEQRIEELEASIEKLSSENMELKKQVDKAGSENKALGAVAARAVELETEVSRLQHDLVSAMSDLQESTVELSNLQRDFEGMKGREKEKDAKLEAIKIERALLVAKVEKLAGMEGSLRVELEEKERKIEVLKKNIEELKALVGSSKSLEKLKNELEKTIEQMKVEISILENRLDEKDKVISGFETKERAVLDAVNGGVKGDGMVEGGKKGLVGGLKQREWVVVGGTTIAAVAVIGVTCYKHAARKH